MLKVIYRALPGSDFQRAFQALASAGLHPVALDDPDPDAALSYATGNSVRVRIAVPESQVAPARVVLRAATRESPESVALARNFERGALKFLAGVAVLGGLTALGYQLDPDFPWYAVMLGVGGLAILIMVLRARKRPEE